MKLIVEGIKTAGKSTICQRILRTKTTATYLEFRSYFSDCEKEIFDPDSVSKLESLMGFLKSISGDDVLIQRCHIFPFQYSENPNFQKNEERLRKLDLEFEQMGYSVLLLTVNQSAFLARTQARPSISKTAEELDSHCKTMMQNQLRLQKAAASSKMRKLIFDSSKRTEQETERAVLQFSETL